MLRSWLSMRALPRTPLVPLSRRKRIAAGSGTSIADVNKLLKGFDQMQSVMKMLGGGKSTKGVRGKARLLKQLRNIDTSQLPL